MSDNKTVLITGATRGIGLAFVEHYAACGWNVVAAARSLDTADTLRSLDPHRIVQLDVSDEASIQRAARELEDETIDLLINNAGVLSRETLDNTNKADLMTQFEVNTVGPYLVTQAFLPHLKKAAAANGIAKVLNVSSLHGSVSSIATGGLYGYRASKAAFNMVNKSLSLDLKADSIVTIVASPGYVATDMNNHQGALQAEDSVALLANVVDGMTLQHTGNFYDRTGNALPWTHGSDGGVRR